MSDLPVRIWNPVILGGGVYRVVVVSWGKTFCSVRLESSVVRVRGTAHVGGRPYMARPEELHPIEKWEAEHGRLA